MKKLVAVFTALCLASGAFALEMSAGGMFNYNFKGASVKNGDVKISVSNSAIAVKGFFDAQYATVFLGGVFDVGKITTKSGDLSDKRDMQFQYLSLGILGKYPFAVGSIAKIYPLVGFDFDIALGGTWDGKKLEDFRKGAKDAFDHYYFDIGVGSDIMLGEHFLLRPQALFGMQMNKPEEYKDAKCFGYKFDLGLGVGYKF